ncbi:hypothetical protein AAF712_016098 [Marasmius tenuissimus]|uniref:Uncharacterized protein n=1 Tax=Marasmius tenuissimus TaxID=585030 RepID=A0ABR2Z7M9_9AGAR
MAHTLAMYDLLYSSQIWSTRKKSALPRQPKSFGLAPGHLFQALKRHLGFHQPLPFAPLLSLQPPPPFVPHTHFAQVFTQASIDIPASSSTDCILNLDKIIMHIPQAPLGRTESEDDMFDGPDSITAEELANIPDSVFDASNATDAGPSTSTPRAKRTISLMSKSPKFLRRTASKRATQNTGTSEAGSSAPTEPEDHATPGPTFPPPMGPSPNDPEGSTTPVPTPMYTMGPMPPVAPWLAPVSQGPSAGLPPPCLPPWLVPTGQGSSAGPPHTFSHSPTPQPTTAGPQWFNGPPHTFSHSPTPGPPPATAGPQWFPMPMYNTSYPPNPLPSNPSFFPAANPAVPTPPSIPTAPPAIAPTPTPPTVLAPPVVVIQSEAMDVSAKSQPEAPAAPKPEAMDVSTESQPEASAAPIVVTDTVPKPLSSSKTASEQQNEPQLPTETADTQREPPADLQPTSAPTTPSKKSVPSTPTTPRTAGRYSKEENTKLEMSFEEMDKIIGKVAENLNVAPKTIYARYITRSSYRSRGGNAWNSYEKYIKITKYMLLEMARLDNDPDLKYDFDNQLTPTADQVSASWQLFKDHHGVEEAEELMAAFEECYEQGTSQTKGARRREFEALVKSLTTISRQAQNRSHFQVVAFAVGGMVNKDQSLSFVLENGECQGFVEKKLHMTKDRILGRLRSHVHDRIDEGLRIDEIVAAVESYGLTVSGPPVEKLRTTKGDCRTTLIDRAAECNIIFKHNRFPAKNMKHDFMKAGIAIKNWPPTVMIPWEGDVGKKGILALPKDQQALVIDYCLRDDDRKLRFEKVDQKEMMLGKEPILTYAPDQNGETKQVFKIFKESESKSKATDEKPVVKKGKKVKEEAVETSLPIPMEAAPSTPTSRHNTHSTRSTTQATTTTTTSRRAAPKSAEFIEETDSDEENEKDELTGSDDDDDILGLLEDDIVNASDYEDKSPTKSGTKRKAPAKAKGQKGGEGSTAKKAKPTPVAIANNQKPAPPVQSKPAPPSGERCVHFSGQEAEDPHLNKSPFDQGGFTTMFSTRPADQTATTAPKAKATAPRPTPSSSVPIPLPNMPTMLAGPVTTGAAATAATAGSTPAPPNAPTTLTPATAAQAIPAPQAMQQQPPTTPMTPQMQQWMVQQQQQQWLMSQMSQMSQMTPEQQAQHWQYLLQFMPSFAPQMGGGSGVQGGNGNTWGQFPNQPQGGGQ